MNSISHLPLINHKFKYIGGTTAAHIKPTPFLCLVCKMLQIQPEKDIVVEFIKVNIFSGRVNFLSSLGSLNVQSCDYYFSKTNSNMCGVWVLSISA